MHIAKLDDEESKRTFTVTIVCALKSRIAMIASAEGSEMLFAAKPNVLRLTNIHTAIVEIHNAVNSSLSFFFALRHLRYPFNIQPIPHQPEQDHEGEDGEESDGG